MSSTIRFPLDFTNTPLSDVVPRVPFWKGTVLGRQGEPCDGLRIIVQGQVLLCRRSESGEDHALYLLGPGDLFGEGAITSDRAWITTARAVTDGTLHVLPANRLPKLAQYHPDLIPDVMERLAARLERAHRRLDLLCTDTARDRVLGLLRVMADAHGKPGNEGIWVSLPITQSELADMIGVARETVARTLAELENDGAIRRLGRRGLWLR